MDWTAADAAELDRWLARIGSGLNANSFAATARRSAQ
jgi:hypothetical protein